MLGRFWRLRWMMRTQGQALRKKRIRRKRRRLAPMQAGRAASRRLMFRMLAKLMSWLRHPRVMPRGRQQRLQQRWAMPHHALPPPKWRAALNPACGLMLLSPARVTDSSCHCARPRIQQEGDATDAAAADTETPAAEADAAGQTAEQAAEQAAQGTPAGETPVEAAGEKAAVEAAEEQLSLAPSPVEEPTITKEVAMDTDVPAKAGGCGCAIM